MVNSKITAVLCLLIGGFHAVKAAPRESVNHQGVSVDAARSDLNVNDRDIHIAEHVLVLPADQRDQRDNNIGRVSKKVSSFSSSSSSSLNSIHIDLEFAAATCARVGEECEQESDCCPNWTACTSGYCRKL